MREPQLRASCDWERDPVGPTLRELSLPHCHGHPHCGRWHSSFTTVFESVSLSPGAQDIHQSNSAGRALLLPFVAPHMQRIVNEAFRRATELGLSDTAAHGIVERSQRH